MKETQPPRELGELEFAALVVRTIGLARTARLMAFALAWRLEGLESFADVDRWAHRIRERGGPSRAVLYRTLADLRAVREEYAKAERRPIEDVSLEEIATALTPGRAPSRQLGEEAAPAQ